MVVALLLLLPQSQRVNLLLCFRFSFSPYEAITYMYCSQLRHCRNAQRKNAALPFISASMWCLVQQAAVVVLGCVDLLTC